MNTLGNTGKASNLKQSLETNMQVYKENLKLIFTNAIDNVTNFEMSKKNLDNFIIKQANKGKFDEIKEEEENNSLSQGVSKFSVPIVNDKVSKSIILSSFSQKNVSREFNKSLSKSDSIGEQVYESNAKTKPNNINYEQGFYNKVGVTKRKRPDLELESMEDSVENKQEASFNSHKKTRSYKNRKKEEKSSISSFDNLSPINIPATPKTNSDINIISPVKLNDIKFGLPKKEKAFDLDKMKEKLKLIKRQEKEKNGAAYKQTAFDMDYWYKKRSTLASARVSKRKVKTSNGITKSTRFKQTLDSLAKPKNQKPNPKQIKKTNNLDYILKLVETKKQEKRGKRHKSVLGNIKHF